MQTRRDFIAAGSLAVGATLLAGHTAGASPTKNRRIVLAKRPQGEPTPADFRLEEAPIPALKDGEILMQTVFLSLDPYMRGRMSEGPSYAASTGLERRDDRRHRVARDRAAAIRSSRKATWCRRTAAGRSTRCRTARASTSSIRASRGLRMRSACSACPGSPRTSARSTSASRRPARRWSSLRRPAQSARSSGRSRRSKGCARSASRAARRSAITP